MHRKPGSAAADALAASEPEATDLPAGVVVVTARKGLVVLGTVVKMAVVVAIGVVVIWAIRLVVDGGIVVVGTTTGTYDVVVSPTVVDVVLGLMERTLDRKLGVADAMQVYDWQT